MNLKRAALLLLLTCSVLYSCKKDTAPAKPAEEPGAVKDELTITDGTGCKFANTSGRNDVTLGFPRDRNRQKTTGTVKVAVIFVDFPDAEAWRSPQDVFNSLSAEAADFMHSASHGQLEILFEPQFRWHRMSKRSDQYGWQGLTFDLHKTYIQEAVSLADPDYDFTGADEILVIANPDARALNRTSAFIGRSSNGILADSRVIANAITAMGDVFFNGGRWFPHEFGHSMGAPDLYSFKGSLHGYMGVFDVMGNSWGSAPVYNAWEQWLFGWFSDSQVSCVRGKGSGSAELTPLEEAEGLKLLVLPLNATSAVIVEDRRRTGYDQYLAKEGPLVYLIDTHIASGEGSLKVLPLNTADQQKTDAPLSPGQSLTYKNITVTCTASAAGGSTIAYERK